MPHSMPIYTYTLTSIHRINGALHDIHTQQGFEFNFQKIIPIFL